MQEGRAPKGPKRDNNNHIMRFGFVELDANLGSFYAKLWWRKGVICNFKMMEELWRFVVKGEFWWWHQAFFFFMQICSDLDLWLHNLWWHRERLCKFVVHMVWKEIIDLAFKLVRNNVAKQVLLFAHAWYENNETVSTHVQDEFLLPLLTLLVSDSWRQICKYCTSFTVYVELDYLLSTFSL